MTLTEKLTSALKMHSTSLWLSSWCRSLVVIQSTLSFSSSVLHLCGYLSNFTPNYIPVRVYNGTSLLPPWSVSTMWIYHWVATTVILTIDAWSLLGIYKGPDSNTWWLYMYIDMFTSDEYYNCLIHWSWNSTLHGHRRNTTTTTISSIWLLIVCMYL